MQQQNWHSLRADSHKVRGVAANLGLSSLQNILTRLENAAAKQDNQTFVATLPELVAELDTITTQLPDLNPADTDQAAPVDRATLLQRCDIIATALKHSTIDNHTQQYLQEIAGVFPRDTEQLQQEIDDFNFETALQLLQLIIIRLQED